MAGTRNAISLGVVSLVVIAIIVIAGFSLYLDTTLNQTTVTSGHTGATPPSSSSSNNVFFNGSIETTQIYPPTSNPSTTTSTCSGYPPGGNCHANYSYTFTITVNYTGPWSLSYRGFHNTETSGQNSNQNYTGGSYNGTGYYANQVSLSGDNFHFLTLCATAYKHDNSTSLLTLTVTGSNSTSAPFGSTYYCGGVAP